MASSPQHLKDHWQESRLVLSRLVAAGIVVLVLSAVLIVRLVHLQVFEYQRYSDESLGNRFKIEPLAPNRGLIFDRKGRPIVDNVPTWQLVAVPEDMSDREGTLRELEALGLVDPSEHDSLLETLKTRKAFDRIELNSLNDEQAATFAVRRHRFPGVDIQEALKRFYVYGELSAHAIGYVGRVSNADLQRVDIEDYPGTSQIGKSGLERAYEDVLHGQVGWRQQVRNAAGRVLYDPAFNDSADPDTERLVRGIETQWPVPGDNIYTSLDMELQRAAVEALGELRGAVVAIDPANGDVLAFVSKPSFDPNRFASGLSQTDYNSLVSDPGKPLLNRAMNQLYPPGSTVKPFIALGALEYDVISPAKTLFCGGHYSLQGQTHRYRDWKPEGHGALAMSDAIAQSCDVYFYRLAVDMGIDRLGAAVRRFGFGVRTGIDIAGENAGASPSQEFKKALFKNRQDQTWYPGETVIAGIGQGLGWDVTALQLAHATATLAARGTSFAPRLRVGIESGTTGDTQWTEPQRLEGLSDVDPAHWQVIQDAMVAVASGPRGSARTRFEKTGYSVAAKTGTAQVVGIAQGEKYNEEELAEEHRDHGLFVAYAPAEAPTVALAIIVENGGGGNRAAAPVARKILDAFFASADETTVVELGPIEVAHDHSEHDEAAEPLAAASRTAPGAD